MSDRSVEEFKQEGKLYLWHYSEGTRNYPGWHFSADRTGIRNLVALIDLMVVAPFGSRRTLIVTPPPPAVPRVANNRGGQARCESAPTLLLDCRKGDVIDGRLSLSAGEACIKLVGGEQGLAILKTCVFNLPRGENDYAIKVGGGCLWFW